MKNTRYVHCTHYRLGGGDYSVLQKKLRWRPRSLRSRQAPMGCRKTSLRCYWASDVRRGLLYLVNTSEAQQKRGDVSAKLLEVRQERMDRCRCRRMLSKSGWLWSHSPLPVMYSWELDFVDTLWEWFRFDQQYIQHCNHDKLRNEI